MNPKSCISHWYKTVSRVIRTPSTRIVRLQGHLEPPGMGEPLASGVLEQQLLSLLTPAVDDVGGLPCILRSGHTAVKHCWRETCLIEDWGQIVPNALRIAEASRTREYGKLPTDVWAVRQIVPTRPLVKTYQGLPVCPEWRIIVQGDNVIDCIAKWTPEEIHAGQPVSREWIDQFDAYFHLRDIDRKWAEQAAKAAGLALARAGDTETWEIDVIKDQWTAWWVLDAKIHEGGSM